MAKTYEIYHISDEKIQRARRLLAHALKYLCEVNGRKRDMCTTYRDPFVPYHLYIHAFNDIAGTFVKHVGNYPPESFLKTLMQEDPDISDITAVVEEFLSLVSVYMSLKTKQDVHIAFLPFYHEQSYENFYFTDDVSDNYFKWIREQLIGKMKYTKEELFESLLTVSCSHKDVLNNPGYYDKLMLDNESTIELNENDLPLGEIEEELSEIISNAISDKTGFCHKGYTFKIVVDADLDKS